MAPSTPSSSRVAHREGTLSPAAPSLHIHAAHAAVPGPDDSDFLDSDDDIAPSGRAASRDEVEDVCAPATSQTSGAHEDAAMYDFPNSSAPSSARSAAVRAVMPLHPLIPIAPALSFTFFASPPSTATLNAHNGSRSALLPPGVQDAPHPQALDSDGGTAGFERYTWFSIDDDLVYLSFYEDWGPLNIAMFYRFCLHVHHLMESDPTAHLVLYTSSAPQQKANAALLVALYSMIIERNPVADAFHPFSQIEFQPFRDAGYGRADFHLSLQDVLHGVSRALQCELLNLSTFNLDEYEHYEQVANGDWNWLTPSFIAFASPNDREYTNALRARIEGRPSRSLRRPIPETFRNTIRYFRDRGVGAVVRLNNPLYDSAEFENAGIKHVDMYFDDGSNPSEEILRDFIALADAQIAAGRVVAVHCKAGLGRTGVLIGAYLIWRHGFSANEVIGFMRFMRPGCVVGPQQHFMYENATEWVRWRVRHEMRLEVAKELAEAEARVATATAASAAAAPANELRTSRKRSADEQDGELASDAASAEQPTTPRNKRANLAPPAETTAGTSAAGSSTGAPAVKPTPCVGQPRKSPSPARKRPATRAPSGTSSRVPSSGNARAGYPQGSSALAAHAPAAAPTPRAPGTGYMPRSVSDESIRAAAAAAASASSNPGAGSCAGSSSGAASNHSSSSGVGARVPGTPGPSARLEAAALAAPGTPGRVLGEAQRLNVQAGVGVVAMPHTPPTSGTSVLARVKAATVGRVRHGHERTRSALAGAATFAPPTALEDVFLDSLPASLPAPDTPTTPRSLASRTPTFRASPLIKSKYGLRDTSEDTGAENLVPAPASAPVTGSVKAGPSAQHARSQTTQPRSGSGSATLDARRKPSGSATRSLLPSTGSNGSTNSSSSSTASTRGVVRAATSRYAAPTAASTAAATAARRARLDTKTAPHPYAAGRTAVPSALPHVQRIGRSVRGRRSSVGEADCV